MNFTAIRDATPEQWERIYRAQDAHHRGREPVECPKTNRGEETTVPRHQAAPMRCGACQGASRAF
jgi:hypothetical protein